jgi:glycosyltransferase involved in cell wall biosynthesis
MSAVATNILVLAPNPWHGQWVNRQQLFSRLGMEYTVVYSSGGFHSWDLGSSEWQEATWRGQFSRSDNVWVDSAPKLLTRIPRVAPLDRWTLQQLVRRWRRVFRQHGSGVSLVMYVFHPMFRPYVEALQPDRLVYHVYDKYDHMPGWTDALEADERWLATHADLVVAASEEMAEGLRNKGAAQVHHLPNGAHVEAFKAALSHDVPEPDDLQAIPHPRLGWVGSLHPQVDYAMVAELAQRRPQWQFVFVGDPSPQRDDRAEADRALCRSRPNVHFLGGRPIGEIPRYVSKMDVNLMCYRLADQQWIRAIYPLKLHEYLAAGHPVVSADIPSVRPFADVVQIVDGVDAWEAALDDALHDRGRGTRAARQEVADANSWDHRVGLLSGWLAEMRSAPRRSAAAAAGRPLAGTS